MEQRCEEFCRQLPRSLMGDLDSEQQRILDTHLAVCAPCSRQRDLYVGTLQRLTSLGDREVPHHFFVYADEREVSPWGLFWQGSRWRRAAALAAAVVLVMTLSVLTSNIRVSRHQGGWTFGFGLDIDSVKAEIVDTIETRIRRENQTLMESLTEDLAQFRSSLTKQQEELLDAGLMDLASRLNDRLIRTQTALHTDTENSLEDLYRLMQTEREYDMALVTDRLDRITMQHEMRATETDSVLSALIEVVGLRER